MTKSLNCQVVISEDVYKTSGIAVDELSQTQVAIRGRIEPMAVRTATDPTVLTGLRDSKATAPAH